MVHTLTPIFLDSIPGLLNLCALFAIFLVNKRKSKGHMLKLFQEGGSTISRERADHIINKN
jgi:hypothetical protein